MANRHKPLENTLRILKDPSTDRCLYLIGSTHGSQLLANRTSALIQEVQPD